MLLHSNKQPFLLKQALYQDKSPLKQTTLLYTKAPWEEKVSQSRNSCGALKCLTLRFFETRRIPGGEYMTSRLRTKGRCIAGTPSSKSNPAWSRGTALGASAVTGARVRVKNSGGMNVVHVIIRLKIDHPFIIALILIRRHASAPRMLPPTPPTFSPPKFH